MVYDTFLRYGKKEMQNVGDMFIQAGILNDTVYMTIEGSCIFIHTDVKGLSRSCGILPAGGLAGLGPAWQKRRTEVSVMCLEPVMVYGVPAEFFIQKIHAELEVENELLKHVMGSMSAVYRALMLQISLNLPQRLALFLQAFTACAGAVEDQTGRVTLPLKLTHEKLGMVINASRVTTTMLLNHLGKMDMLEQIRGGLRFPARLIEGDFIIKELCKEHWSRIRS